MGVATTVRDAANIKRANENETRREMIASQYITMPGIPSSEKEQLEKSLRYNLWASLIRFIVLNFVLTCVWFFGFGLGFDAIKAATGNLAQESKTMALAEGRLDMYSGEDGLIVPLMSIGAKGVISVLSNVAPKQTHDICATFAAGDVAKAAQLQFKALELVDALFCEVNPIPVKHALNLMGWDMGPLRSPLCEMEEANLERLKKAMVNYGIL